MTIGFVVALVGLVFLATVVGYLFGVQARRWADEEELERLREAELEGLRQRHGDYLPQPRDPVIRSVPRPNMRTGRA